MNEIQPSKLHEMISELAKALSAIERIAGPNGRSVLTIFVPDEERFAIVGPPDARMFLQTPSGELLKLRLARLDVPRHTVFFVGPPEVCGGSAAETVLEDGCYSSCLSS